MTRVDRAPSNNINRTRASRPGTLRRHISFFARPVPVADTVGTQFDPRPARDAIRVRLGPNNLGDRARPRWTNENNETFLNRRPSGL